MRISWTQKATFQTNCKEHETHKILAVNVMVKLVCAEADVAIPRDHLVARRLPELLLRRHRPWLEPARGEDEVRIRKRPRELLVEHRHRQIRRAASRAECSDHPVVELRYARRAEAPESTVRRSRAVSCRTISADASCCLFLRAKVLLVHNVPHFSPHIAVNAQPTIRMLIRHFKVLIYWA